MNNHERTFLRLICNAPGVYAAELPRAKRGETIKALELGGLIAYGPSGWIPTDAGTAADKQPIDPGGLSLHAVLKILGYTTEPATVRISGLSGGKRILRGNGTCAHEGSADSTWKWLRATGQVK